MHSILLNKNHTVALSPASNDVPRSMHLPLADRRDLTGTSQPTLGVLCFPLSPLSRKGATHYQDGTSSSQLASQGRATTPLRDGKSQLPQVNQSSH
jgi:hypothetical protein